VPRRGDGHRPTPHARWPAGDIPHDCAVRPLAVAALTLVAVAVAALPPVAEAASAPLAPYPAAAASPVGNSRLPLFLDDDETVRATLTPEGGVRSLVDDILLKLRGTGDYAVFLPGHATAVRDLGGDAVPGLQDGHVSFLGFLGGAAQMGAEAGLDPSAARDLPLSVAITYATGGRNVAAPSLAQARGPVTVTIAVNNLTRHSEQFVRGSAAAPPLATALEALRQVPGLYTPETDLNAVLPLPESLPIAGPTSTQAADTYVPLALTVDVRLPAGASVTDAGGGDVNRQPGGTRVRWVARLPAGPDSGGAATFSLRFTAAAPGAPGVEVRADPLPLPAPVFTAPGGAAWTTYLAGAADRSGPTLLAQQGAASLHRIADLVPPIGRPGPGPVKVKYDLVLASGQAPASRPAPASAPRGQPWAIALVTALLVFGLLSGVSAWARH